MVKTTFVHLSDIHYGSLGMEQIHDFDSDIRNELERDLVKMKQEIGTIAGLLITGDVTFSGAEEEFTSMGVWLDRVSGILDIDRHKIWVIPGNHDVQRNIVDSSQFLKLCHNRLRTIELVNLDKEIKIFLDDSLSASLYQPLQNYNKFAAGFGCGINPKNPFWKDTVDLNDGSELHLCGLNSAFISDGADSKDHDQTKLVLGQVQTNLLRKSGTVYLVLCHHPPSWLRDEATVKRNLNAKAIIQLYGHEHNQNIEVVNGKTLILYSGSLHPKHTESVYEPRYNLFSMFVEGVSSNRKLNVEVFPRIWIGMPRRLRKIFQQTAKPLIPLLLILKNGMIYLRKKRI